MVNETIWVPERPVAELPRDIAPFFREEADILYEELSSHRLKVKKVPAPEPRHVGHGIRKVESRNPEWYQELYYAHAKSVRKTWRKHPQAHGNFRRDLSLDALLRIEEGRDGPCVFYTFRRTYFQRVVRGRDLQLVSSKARSARHYYDYTYRSLIKTHLLHGRDLGLEGFFPPNDLVRVYFGLSQSEPPSDPLEDNDDKIPF